jgi:hypothetical protein
MMGWPRWLAIATTVVVAIALVITVMFPEYMPAFALLAYAAAGGLLWFLFFRKK